MLKCVTAEIYLLSHITQKDEREKMRYIGGKISFSSFSCVTELLIISINDRVKYLRFILKSAFSNR